VPEKCPFDILHLLETRPEEPIQARPRQSGKTCEIVAMANEILDAGQSVCIVTCNEAMAQCIRERYGLNPGADVLSVRSEGGLRGHRGVYLFCDELLPREIDKVRGIMCMSYFVVAYFTPR